MVYMHYENGNYISKTFKKAACNPTLMRRVVQSFVIPLIFVNICIFIFQIVLGQGFTDALVLNKGDLFIRPWTLLTSMFLHGSPMHLVFNMYALLIFGPLLEQRIGAKRFIIAYLGTGLLAGLIASEVARVCDFFPLPQNFCFQSALGASGAILGIIGVTIVLMPNLGILLFFIIPMPLWVFGIIIALIDLFGITPGVASAAHLAGLSAGALYGLHLRGQKREFHKKFKQKFELDDDDVEEYLKSGRI
jgi:membrane associated rhomboid family serine protease